MEFFSRHTVDPVISVDDDYFDCGGNSLELIRLVAELSDATGIDIPIGALAANPTVAFVKDLLIKGGEVRLQSAQSGTQSHDNELQALRSEIDLRLAPYKAAGLGASSSISMSHESDVAFVTGASGFVGRFVLAELLSRKVNTVCLLRDGAAGRDRVMKKLSEFGLWRREFSRFLEVVEGDITKPQMGIHSSVYRELCANVSRIVHCAAWVNHVYRYSQLADVNAHSAVELLAFAATVRAKRLTYVSTGAVVESTNYLRDLEVESVPLSSIPADADGYARSKAVGELYFGRGAEFGVPVVIVRIPNIFGDRKRFQVNSTDSLWNWIKAIIATNRYPRSFDLSGNEQFQALPADVVARVIVDANCGDKGVSGRIVNAIPNLACSSRVLLAGLREAGYQPEAMVDEEWYSEVSKLDIREYWVAGIAAERAKHQGPWTPQRLRRYSLEDYPEVSHIVNMNAVWSPRDVAEYIRSLAVS